VIAQLCLLALAMSPDAAVRAAMANDPALAEAAAEISSAKGARRSASGLRSNPQLEISVGVAGGKWDASLTQDLSLSGAGMADARSRRYSVEAAEAELKRARLVTAAEARRAWARLAAAEGAFRGAEAERKSATALRGAAEARRAVGEASDLDLELARLDEARAVAAWLEALDERAEAQAALAALTGDAAAAAEGDPLAAAPVAGEGGTRSDLVAAEARVAAAKAARTRERAEAVPALGVGAFVEADGGRILVGPSLGIELPLWQQNAAGRGAAEGELRVAEAQASATRARAEAERRAAEERLGWLGDRGASLAPGVDASAEAALRAVDAGVAAGEIDTVQAALLRSRVFEGQRGWYAARLAEAEGRIDAALATGDEGLLVP
jgi:cobalt-zinc-cadmium efflux system outer membrane protein